MTKIKYFFVLTLLISSCSFVYQRQIPPDYMVMLTNIYPNVSERCTGALLDSWTILGVAHCAKGGELIRAVTQNGQEAFFHPLVIWPDIDTALFRLETPLYATEYVHFGEPDKTKTAFIFGTCPFYFSNNPKPLVYIDTELAGVVKPLIEYEHWHSLSSEPCGGDSGGFLWQDGNYLGATSALLSDIPFVPIGTELYVVPQKSIRQKLDNYQNGLYNK